MFLLTFFMFYSWFSSVIVILFYYLHPTFRPVYYSKFDGSGVLTFDKFIQALMLPDLIFYTLFILIFSFLVKMLLEQSNDPLKFNKLKFAKFRRMREHFWTIAISIGLSLSLFSGLISQVRFSALWGMYLTKSMQDGVIKKCYLNDVCRDISQSELLLNDIKKSKLSEFDLNNPRVKLMRDFNNAFDDCSKKNKDYVSLNNKCVSDKLKLLYPQYIININQ